RSLGDRQAGTADVGGLAAPLYRHPLLAAAAALVSGRAAVPVRRFGAGPGARDRGLRERRHQRLAALPAADHARGFRAVAECARRDVLGVRHCAWWHAVWPLATQVAPRRLPNPPL